MPPTKNRIMMFAVSIIAMLVLAGCPEMNVALNPKAPMDQLAGKKLPYRVALYMDTEFQNFQWREQNNAEMSSMNYALGIAAKSLFMDTFLQISKGLQNAAKKPPYAPEEGIDAVIVIEPHIVAFSERHSLARTALYTAHIAFKVIVYNSKGDKLLEQVYQGNGEAPGKATYSPASNYAAPAENAMCNAIVAIVNDICNLKIQ